MQKWDVPARILETLLLTAIIIQAVIYWDQVDEMRIDRRAWVAAGSVKGFPKSDEPFRWTVVIANTGKTFAKHINVAGVGGWYSKGQHPDFVKEIKQSAATRDPDKISDVLLAPNGTTESTSEQKEEIPILSTKGIETIKGEIIQGQISFMFFGQITYDDIFGHHHWLIFCNKLGYDKRRTENEGWGWDVCKEWNDTGDGPPKVPY